MSLYSYVVGSSLRLRHFGDRFGVSTISTLSRDTLYLIDGVLVVLTEFTATGTVRQLLLGVLKSSKASNECFAFSAGAGKPMFFSMGLLFSTARFLLLPLLLMESLSTVRVLAILSLFSGVEGFSREVLLLLLLFLGGLPSSFVTTLATLLNLL